MTNRVIGPGIGLPAPQLLYPANLTPQGIPYTAGSAEISLPAGGIVQIPAGDWMIDLGKYSILEYQDPVRSGPNITQTAGVWRPIRSQRGTFTLRSDGINFRIANLTGCAVGAIITQGGQNYVASSTTVTPSTGTSVWTPIIGGAIQALTCSVVGANYGKAPIIYIPAPPAPGIQASAIATIGGGVINGITITNQGAGYTVAPPITILPDPFDSATNITTAVAACALTGTGSLTGVLLENSGAPVASTMTLTVAGAGTSAFVSPYFLSAVSSLTITQIGTGSFTGGLLTTTDGVPSATAAWKQTDPYFLPRAANIQLTATSGQITGAGSTAIIDGGLFLGTAIPVIALYGGSYADATAANSVLATLTQGGVTDTIIVQPI